MKIKFFFLGIFFLITLSITFVFFHNYTRAVTAEVCRCVVTRDGGKATAEPVIGPKSQEQCADLTNKTNKEKGPTGKDVAVVYTDCRWELQQASDAGAISNLKGKAQGSLNPLGLTNAADLMGRVVKIGMSIIGSIAFVLFIYGGILWMTASGNSERETKARHILIWGSLGLVVILASYALVKFVFESVT